MEVLRGLGWDAKAGRTTPLAVMYADLVVAPLRRMYSWAVPNNEAIRTICKRSPRGVVEMGAGTGYWSRLLKEEGLEVHPFDRHPTHARSLNPQHRIAQAGKQGTWSTSTTINPPPFCRVFAGGAEVLNSFSKQALLLCWPPAEEEVGVEEHVRFFAWECLRQFRGDTLVFVGEEQEDQNATAGGRFFQCLRCDWSLEETVSIPQWPCSKDRLTVWLRKTALPSSSDEPYFSGTTETIDTPVLAEFECGRQRLIQENQEAFEDLAARPLWRKKRHKHRSLTAVESELLDAWMARATWWEKLKAWG